MPDFFQNGVIATLHRLGDRPVAELEAELTAWGADRPMALVIPCLYAELDGPALKHIVDELAAVPYLDEIVIGLDRADADGFAHARQFFSRLPQHHRIVWNDGPGLQAVDDELADHGLAPAEPGKGRNAWYCLGYLLAADRARIIALHDADILTYDRSLPARLLHPLAHPDLDFAFAKGFYDRAVPGTDGSSGFNGRVSRLCLTPLVRALAMTFGSSDHLDYLDSFRYPLAGECAMDLSVARSLRVPSDWGLEIGVLSEVFRRYTPNRVCQVDLAGGYDHKHQGLSPDDRTGGLHRMSGDIAKALFRKLAVSGVVLTSESFRTIRATYTRVADDLIDRYQADATINGIRYDRAAEEAAVALFGEAILRAGAEVLADPTGSPFIPSWARVAEALPHLPARLVEAVEADAGR